MLNASGACVDGMTISRTNDGFLCACLMCMAYAQWGGVPLTAEKAHDDVVETKGCISRYLTSQGLTLDGTSL
jgi:hypothetical protein